MLGWVNNNDALQLFCIFYIPMALGILMVTYKNLLELRIAFKSQKVDPSSVFKLREVDLKQSASHLVAPAPPRNAQDLKFSIASLANIDVCDAIVAR